MILEFKQYKNYNSSLTKLEDSNLEDFNIEL